MSKVNKSIKNINEYLDIAFKKEVEIVQQNNRLIINKKHIITMTDCENGVRFNILYDENSLVFMFKLFSHPNCGQIFIQELYIYSDFIRSHKEKSLILLTLVKLLLQAQTNEESRLSIFIFQRLDEPIILNFLSSFGFIPITKYINLNYSEERVLFQLPIGVKNSGMHSLIKIKDLINKFNRKPWIDFRVHNDIDGCEERFLKTLDV